MVSNLVLINFVALNTVVSLTFDNSSCKEIEVLNGGDGGSRGIGGGGGGYEGTGGGDGGIGGKGGGCGEGGKY